MSFNKSVQKIFFMLAISISAILLCLVGVWAATMNLNLQGKVSPDIHCSIIANESMIFNNNNEIGGQMSSGNTLSASVKLGNDSSLTTAVVFKLTNYTPDKYIRLSVASISGATIKSGDVAVCQKATKDGDTITPSATQTMTIHIAGESQASATINLKVEEVFKVAVKGAGLALDANDGDATYDYFFFAPNDNNNNPQITIEPMIGYQLPTALSIANSNHGEYRTNNQKGVISLNTADIVDNDVVITANCNQIFELKKSTMASLGTPNANDDDKAFTLNPDTTYLPNNGHYSYTITGYEDAEQRKPIYSTTQGTLKSTFVEYPYYIEMGLYPQTEYDAAPSGNYEQVGDKYYLYETIKWIVLGAVDGTNLSTLHFKQFDGAESGMLYTDGACGKPYTGQLVLLSAYIIDGSEFNGTLSIFNGSSVATKLDNLNNKLTGTNGLTMANAAKASSSNPQGQYLKTQSLVSQAYNSTGGVIADSLSKTFFLLGGVGTISGSSTKESYFAGNYFDINGIRENQDNATFNIGVASATDYALANNVEKNTLTLLGGGSEIATAARGWAITNDTTTTSTSAYWTRSGGESSGAWAINMNAIPKNVLITNTNVGVRPMMVLDLGFYENGTYTA